MKPSILQDIQHFYDQRRQLGLVSAYWHIGRCLTHFVADLPTAREGDWGLTWSEALDHTPSLKHSSLRLAQLRLMARFYQLFPEINLALTWTHYCHLIRIANDDLRTQYVTACLAQHWTAKQLARQIKSRFLERQHEQQENYPILSDYVLEFLNLTPDRRQIELELERALIDRMQDFLLELGKGFAFVARQQIIRTETGKSYRIDLVFYHYLLKCFVLVDLKTTPLTHRDVGQMDTYLRLFEAKWRKADDQPTLGILLTTEKDESLLHYSMLADHQHLLAAQYQFHLPNKTVRL